MNKEYYIYLAFFNNLPFDVQVEKVLLSFEEFEINYPCDIIIDELIKLLYNHF